MEPMPNKRKRKNFFGLWASRTEAYNIMKAARRSDLSSSAFIRLVVLTAADGKEVARPDATCRALRYFTAEIDRFHFTVRSNMPNDAERIVFELRRLHRSVYRLLTRAEDGS